MSDNIPLVPAVIFDMDGTLANVVHRRHFVEGKKKYFKTFHEHMIHDTKNEVVAGTCNQYYMNNWHIIICTGRPEKYRELTEKWLKDHGIFYKELRMRPDDETSRPDFEVKQDMLNDILKTRTVRLAVDDRQQVVDMWRRNGIVCYQCDVGDF